MKEWAWEWLKRQGSILYILDQQEDETQKTELEKLMIDFVSNPEMSADADEGGGRKKTSTPQNTLCVLRIHVGPISNDKLTKGLKRFKTKIFIHVSV